MRNEDLKLLLDAQFTAVRATMQSETNRIDLKLDHVIEHQQWQNGKLNEHGEDIVELKTNDSNRAAIKKARAIAAKRWGLYVTMGGTLCGVVYLILDHIR